MNNPTKKVIMRGKLFFMATIAIAFMFLAQTAIAADGIVQNKYPPPNAGAVLVVVQIEEIGANGMGLGRPYFVFKITKNVAIEPWLLHEGDRVTFDKGPGNTATNVALADNPPPPPGGE